MTQASFIDPQGDAPARDRGAWDLDIGTFFEVSLDLLVIRDIEGRVLKARAKSGGSAIGADTMEEMCATLDRDGYGSMIPTMFTMFRQSLGEIDFHARPV